MPKTETVISISDTNPIFAEGFAAIAGPDYKVIRDYTGDFKSISANPNLKLAVIGQLKTPFQNIDLLDRIKDLPVATAVFIDDSDSPEYLQTICQKEVNAILGRNTLPQDLKQAITETLNGNSYIDPSITRRIISIVQKPVDSLSKRPYGLSNREADVLRLIGEGFPNTKIAEALCVSPRTVSNHVTSLYHKLATLGVDSRVGLGLKAKEVLGF